MLRASKDVTIGGRSYKTGEPVDGSMLAEGKVQQLIARRILRDDVVSSPKRCVFLRDQRVKGKDYKKGTVVVVSSIPAGKVAQMLDHRILGLVNSAA